MISLPHTMQADDGLYPFPLAMPSARAAAASRWSLLRVSSRASIAIAVFALSYFAAALVSGAGQ